MPVNKIDIQNTSSGPNSSNKPQWPKLTSAIIHGFAGACLTKFMDDASQFAPPHVS